MEPFTRVKYGLWIKLNEIATKYIVNDNERYLRTMGDLKIIDKGYNETVNAKLDAKYREQLNMAKKIKKHLVSYGS